MGTSLDQTLCENCGLPRNKHFGENQDRCQSACERIRCSCLTHFFVPVEEPRPIVAEASTDVENFEAYNVNEGDLKNAGAEAFARILLEDNGQGVMSPGPCADAQAAWRRLKAANANLLEELRQLSKTPKISPEGREMLLTRLVDYHFSTVNAIIAQLD